MFDHQTLMPMICLKPMMMPALLPAFEKWGSSKKVELWPPGGAEVALLTSWSHQFINAHNKLTSRPSMLTNVKVRKLICGTFFRDHIAFAVESDSDLLNFLLGLFFVRITWRSSGGLLHWAAVKKHSPSQKLLNWNTETHWNTENSGKTQETRLKVWHNKKHKRAETTRNRAKKPNHWKETEIGGGGKRETIDCKKGEKAGDVWGLLKGCESVREGVREEVVITIMMTNVGIYEFNAKDLIGHGAFAVVYKGRLKSVSRGECANKSGSKVSFGLCIFLSVQLRGAHFSFGAGPIFDLCFGLHPHPPLLLLLLCPSVSVVTHSLSVGAVENQLTLFSLPSIMLFELKTNSKRDDDVGDNVDANPLVLFAKYFWLFENSFL